MVNKENTYTFLLHGTMYHRESEIETMIGPIADACSNKDNLRIIDGPGGRSRFGETDNPIPGTYYYDPKTKKKIRKETKIPDALAQAVGAVAGFGVEDNLIEMLDTIIHQEPPPKRINLLGFSRGADTSLRFANLLYQYLPHIEVNIFALEPVAGPGRRNDPYACNIPPNVRHYVSTLATHQHKSIFEPQDFSRLHIEDPSKTKVELLPYPGIHGTHSRTWLSKPGTHYASEIIADLAAQHLIRWGTELDYHPDYTSGKKTTRKASDEPQDNKNRLEKYAKLILVKKDSTVFGKLAKNRICVRRLRDHTPILPQYFLNSRHLKMFAKAFPKTFEYLKNPTDENTKAQASGELEEMRQHYPSMMEWIESTKLTKQRVYFNVATDKLDGNYRKIVIGVHHYFSKATIKSGKQYSQAKTLLREARNILTSDNKDKEGSLKKLYDDYTQQYPDTTLSTSLKNEFVSSHKTSINIIEHELKAARNLTIFRKVKHHLKRAVSSEYRALYKLVEKEIDDILKLSQSQGTELDRSNAISEKIKSSITRILEQYPAYADKGYVKQVLTALNRLVTVQSLKIVNKTPTGTANTLALDNRTLQSVFKKFEANGCRVKKRNHLRHGQAYVISTTDKSKIGLENRQSGFIISSDTKHPASHTTINEMANLTKDLALDNAIVSIRQGTAPQRFEAFKQCVEKGIAVQSWDFDPSQYSVSQLVEIDGLVAKNQERLEQLQDSLGSRSVTKRL